MTLSSARFARARSHRGVASRWAGWRWLRCLAFGCVLSGCRGKFNQTIAASGGARILSLSPALTETVFALGAGDRVVAVSDYCHEPASVEGLVHVGTIFSPRYEAIAVARPTLILAERIDGTNVSELERIAATATYRWLTYEDILSSTRALGERLGRVSEAARLVAEYRAVLGAKPNPSGPRILLTLAHKAGQLSEVWFIRRNSIHGRVLEAAGATNAVGAEIVGPPRMALERAVALDPDAIIVLEPSAAEDPALLEDWRRLTAMRAVREGHLALLAAPELEVPGPRIVRLVERLRAVIAKVIRPSDNRPQPRSSASGLPGVVE